LLYFVYGTIAYRIKKVVSVFWRFSCAFTILRSVRHHLCRRTRTCWQARDCCPSADPVKEMPTHAFT
jgi:hypothetical protein